MVDGSIDAGGGGGGGKSSSRAGDKKAERQPWHSWAWESAGRAKGGAGCSFNLSARQSRRASPPVRHPTAGRDTCVHGNCTHSHLDRSASRG